MWEWLLKIFGPCSEEVCAQPGTQLYTPHPNSQPIYPCPQHKEDCGDIVSATPTQIQDLARTIAYQATAIADDLLSGTVHDAVALLASDVRTLQAWVPDNRA